MVRSARLAMPSIAGTAPAASGGMCGQGLNEAVGPWLVKGISGTLFPTAARNIDCLF